MQVTKKGKKILKKKRFIISCYFRKKEFLGNLRLKKQIEEKKSRSWAHTS